LGDQYTFGGSEAGDNVDYKIHSGNFTDGGAGGRFRFFTAESGGTSTQKFIILPSGKVGIGTAAPTEKLHVEGSSGGINVKVRGTHADGYRHGYELSNGHTGGTTWSMFTTNNSDGVFGGGKLGFANAASGTATAANTRIVIDGSGNVGVKNTSPQNTLEVGTNAQRNAISLRGGANGNAVMVEMVDGKTGGFSSVTVDIQYSGAGGYGYQIHSYGTGGSYYQSGGGYTNGTNNFSHNASQTNGSGWSVSSPSANLLRVVKSGVGTHPGVWVKAYGALSVGLKQSDVTITYA
jgi:hypothetical protein